MLFSPTIGAAISARYWFLWVCCPLIAMGFWALTLFGAGEKDVAVKFDSIKSTMKDNKPYLTLDTNKDALESAPGLKYDSNKTTWVPDNNSK